MGTIHAPRPKFAVLDGCLKSGRVVWNDHTRPFGLAVDRLEADAELEEYPFSQKIQVSGEKYHKEGSTAFDRSQVAPEREQLQSNQHA